MKKIIATIFLSFISMYAHSFNPNFFEEESAIHDRALISAMPEEVVDPYTGALNIINEDVRVPGTNGLDIVLYRMHSPNGSQGNSIGTWSMHMGFLKPRDCQSQTEPITVLEGPSFKTSKGENKQFIAQGQIGDIHKWQSKDHWILLCTNQYFVVIDPNGLRYEFWTRNVPPGQQTCHEDKSLCLTSRISDTHGNYFDMLYQSHPSAGNGVRSVSVLAEINASDGRKIVFTNTNLHGEIEHEINILLGHLKSISVLDSNGNPQRTWTYNYYNEGELFRVKPYLLKEVEYPDGSIPFRYEYHTTSFDVLEHNGPPQQSLIAINSVLKKIIYEQGGIIEYDFYKDCIVKLCLKGGTDGHPNLVGGVELPTIAIRSKTVTGMSLQNGTWEYTYERGLTNLQRTITYDKTTVTLPEPNATETYYHYSRQVRDDFWRIGLLYQKVTTCDKCLKTEQNYTYIKGYKLSDRKDARMVGFDGYPVLALSKGVYAPRLLAEHGVVDGVAYAKTYGQFNDGINPH